LQPTGCASYASISGCSPLVCAARFSIFRCESYIVIFVVMLNSKNKKFAKAVLFCALFSCCSFVILLVAINFVVTVERVGFGGRVMIF